MNAEAEREQIKALYPSMKTTIELVDVSIYAFLYIFILGLDSFLI
jgi:hypothetical protein